MWGLIALGIGVLMCAVAIVCVIVIVEAIIKAILKARKKRKGGIDRWV